MNTAKDIFLSLEPEDQTTVLEAARLAFQDPFWMDFMDIDAMEAERLEAFLTGALNPDSEKAGAK